MANLDTTNYLSLLIEFSFSMLFLLIFVAVHYAISTKTRLGKKIIVSKSANFWYFFVSGFILSLLTVITSQATMMALKSSIGLPITILCLLFAMSFFYNRSIQVGSLIPLVIWVLYLFGGFSEFNYEWLFRIIVILTVTIAAVSATFLKTKKWPTFLISLFIVELISLAIVLIFVKKSTTFYIIELAASFGFAILFFATVNWFNNLLSTMTYMAQTNVYDQGSYIIPSSVTSHFTRLIKQHNISQALIVTFQIKNLKSGILHKIANVFEGVNASLFKSEYDSYGVILWDSKYHISQLNNSLIGNTNLEREKKDPLYNLQQELKDLDVVAFASIYGVHSNDINELLKFNQFAIKQYDATSDLNKVQLFDSNMMNNQIKDEINYEQLIQKVNINDINVELEIIELNKDHKRYVCPRFYWLKMTTCDINEIMQKFDLTTSNALLRSLAIKSLEKYSLSEYKHKLPLIIFYPINELTDKYFSAPQFIKKINWFDVNKEDIILSLSCKKIRLWPRVILNNLVEIQKNQIKFALVDLINSFCLTTLQPEFVILDSSIEKNSKKLENVLEVAKTFKQNILLVNKI